MMGACGKNAAEEMLKDSSRCGLPAGIRCFWSSIVSGLECTPTTHAQSPSSSRTVTLILPLIVLPRIMLPLYWRATSIIVGRTDRVWDRAPRAAAPSSRSCDVRVLTASDFQVAFTQLARTVRVYRLQ